MILFTGITGQWYVETVSDLYILRKCDLPTGYRP